MENQFQKKGVKPKSSSASPEDIGFNIDDSKTYTFKIIDPRAKKSRHYGLGNKSEIYDGTRRRVMRYVPFFDTLWEDEQDPSVKITDSDYAINFHMGILRVDGKNKRLIEYLMKHDRFKGNKNPISGRGPIFDIDDPEHDAKVRLQSNEIMKDAVVAALQATDEDVRTFHFVLYGQTDASESTMKSKLAEFAKAKPEAFLKLVADPRTKRRFLIRKGLDSKVIKIVNSTLKWGISDVDILNMNPTAEPIGFITDWSLSNAGKDFADLLKQQLGE